MTVYVHGKPCNLEKEPLIPRKCLTPDEYLNMLAKPKLVQLNCIDEFTRILMELSIAENTVRTSAQKSRS